MNYTDYLKNKTQLNSEFGFNPYEIDDRMFDFQKYLLDWSLRKGRSAEFADCGLGKTFVELMWAKNVLIHTNKPVLILTPLAVSIQTELEAKKFDIDAKRSSDGSVHDITITNYEKLHYFDANDFSGVVCDESSILKSFDGKYKTMITQFMRKVKYRLLATATAAPNDYIELGTSSEALGYLGYMDMLNKFFKNDQNNSSTKGMYRSQQKWRFKGHAEEPFWRWVSGWAKAMRKPSDFGFNDDGFILPGLTEEKHVVETNKTRNGLLFNMPAVGLKEQLEERRMTVTERAEKAAQIVDTKEPALVWCNRNDEGDYLEKIIPDGVQVSGRDKDEAKEEKLIGFAKGEFRVLITKPKIGAWGLNYQHCAHTTFFPTNSYEQYYQGVRRLYRFGQKKKVKVDFIVTEGDEFVFENLQKKSRQADRMFDRLIEHMSNSIDIESFRKFKNVEQMPEWL